MLLFSYVGNIWTAKPGLSFADAFSLVTHQDEFDAQTKLSIMLIVSRLEKLVGKFNTFVLVMLMLPLCRYVLARVSCQI